MAKEPRSERWQYQPDAVARQPELAADTAPQPVSPSRAGVARDGVEGVLAFPDPALTEIVRSARSALHATAVAIAIDTGAGIVCRARAGESAPDLGAPVNPERGITGECLSTGNVVRCPDTANHPRVDPAFSERWGVRSILAAPLSHNGAVVGVMVAFFPVRYAYSDVGVTRLEEFARAAVVQVFGAEIGADEATEPHPAQAAVERPTELAQASPRELSESDEVVPSERAAAQEMVTPAHWIRRSAPWVAAYAAVAVIAIVLFVLFSPGRNPPSTVPARAAATSSRPLDERTRTAAEAGDLNAEYALAHAYGDGIGVAADPAEAAKWLRRAAEGGKPDAQLELATMLEHDPRALPVEAYTWYVIAWQAGKKDAESAIQRLTPKLSRPEIAQVRYKVGKEYASGQALPHDAISAYVWYSLANAGGDPKARDRLRELESQLTPPQLAEAKSRSATWIRSHAAATTAAASPR